MSEDEAPKKKSRVSWVSWLALLAIVGIVAAIVIPSYADYTERSQVSEAISLMGGAKTPLAEYFADHGTWPRKLDEVTRTTTGKFTASVAITRGAGSKSGEIELTSTMRAEGVRSSVAGRTTRMLSADGGRNWTCRPGTVPTKYLPGACRD